MESKPFPADLLSVSAALDQLWLKFRPQIEERVAVLEEAAAALAEGRLSPGQCADAQSAAHKLAGSLGTFGFIAAGDLAREAENIYQGKPGTESTARLLEIARSLRATMTSGK